MTDMRFEHRMSDADALMWTIEKDPLLRSTITSVAVLRPGARPRPLRARPSTAPPGSSPGCASGCGPTRSRSRRPAGRSTPTSTSTSTSAASAPAASGSLRDVLDLAEPIAMQGFDRARPLWEIDRRRGPRGRAGPRSILKLHHAITDGVGGVKLAMHLFDLDRDGTDHGDDARRAARSTC